MLPSACLPGSPLSAFLAVPLSPAQPASSLPTHPFSPLAPFFSLSTDTPSPSPPTDAGTGPLESDQQLLAGARGVLPPNQLHALLYRMGQKALARSYLAHSKRLLQQEMAHLARLQRG